MPIEGDAEFSIDGRLRLRLDRWWDIGPRALVCMANPSTAGAHDNDATIRNLIALVRGLGYPGFTVVNWLPFIATDPNELYKWRNEIVVSDGPLYRAVHEQAVKTIEPLAARAAVRFIAWGNLVPQVPHTTAICRAMSVNGQHDLMAFGLTKDGSPKHPAARGVHRIIAGTPPIVWCRGRERGHHAQD